MINDDDILEVNETFNLTIDKPLLYIHVVVGNPATVTIVDNDGKYVINNMINRLEWVTRFRIDNCNEENSCYICD